MRQTTGIRKSPGEKIVKDIKWANLEGPLWPVERTTAYRWIKALMADANIAGPQASPKGLRHGYGIHAIQSGVQIDMLRKWMGHTSIETTSIYTNAVGAEERMAAKELRVSPAAEFLLGQIQLSFSRLTLRRHLWLFHL